MKIVHREDRGWCVVTDDVWRAVLATFPTKGAAEHWIDASKPAAGRIGVMKIRLTFIGSGLWDNGDVFPYDDTPFPRVPSVGEWIAMPDQPPQWRVVEVTYDFTQGLHYEPVVNVVCVRDTPERRKHSSTEGSE